MSTTEEQVKMAHQIQSRCVAIAGVLAKVLIHEDDLGERDKPWIFNLLEAADEGNRTLEVAKDLWMDGYDEDVRGLLRRVDELLEELDEVTLAPRSE